MNGQKESETSGTMDSRPLDGEVPADIDVRAGGCSAAEPSLVEVVHHAVQPEGVVADGSQGEVARHLQVIVACTCTHTCNAQEEEQMNEKRKARLDNIPRTCSVETLNLSYCTQCSPVSVLT